MHIAELAGKETLSRRFFMERTANLSLGVGISTAMGLTAARAQAARGQAKNLIYIYCSGGMSHLDTFDVTNKNTGDTGLMKGRDPISTTGDFQLGPEFTNLAKLGNKFAVLNGMHSTNGDHQEGKYMMLTAYAPRATIVHPRVGPFAEHILGKQNEILPDSVVVGQATSNSGWLEPSMSPLPISNPEGGVPNASLLTDDARFKRRMEIAQKLGKQFVDKYKYSGPKSYVEYYDQATKLLTSTELEAFDISGEKNREAYGMNRFGQGCLLARRLVQKGVRVVEVHTGGFDFHEDLKTRAEAKFAPVDQSIATLLQDLEANGLLETTLVVVGTEFGRTPKINMNGGRDHFPAAYSAMMAGAGIIGGQAYGATDKSGKKVVSGKTSPADFVATIGHAMGINLDEVYYSPSRRPFTFGDKGKPAMGLFG